MKKKNYIDKNIQLPLTVTQVYLICSAQMVQSVIAQRTKLIFWPLFVIRNN